MEPTTASPAPTPGVRRHPLTRVTLEMLERPGTEPRPLPDGVRLVRADGMTPEYLRFLYALVGGDWFWSTRLDWSRRQWEEDLAVAGTEVSVLYEGGAPLGYVQLRAQEGTRGPECEILYFGLAPAGLGRGLGGPFLENAVARAWSIGERAAGTAPVRRVVLSTTSHDAPAAIANYRARGFVECRRVEDSELRPDEPLGAWRATSGRTS